MTQLKPLNLWVVELPEGATYVKINEYNDLWFDVPGKTLDWVELPEGKWKALFTTATATEQDWATVIPEPYHRNFLDYTQKQGKGYTVYFFDTATESGHSLLTANGLPVEKDYAILTPKK